MSSRGTAAPPAHPAEPGPTTGPGPTGTDPAGPTSGVAALLAGDQPTLARALSHLERGGVGADDLAARLRPHTGQALVVGFTGPPGAGKSSLIASVVAELRDRGERVAVLAVDPSSPVSGGALLGDRTRMGAHTADPGVYIRSVASRGQGGGLARAIPGMIDAVDAAGWPVVLLETVGSGQSDIEVTDFADIGVLLTVPGLGDDIQALKAGVLELADILVVNKSDLPAARTAARHLERTLALRADGARRPPVLLTSSVTPDGVGALVDAMLEAGRGPDRANPAQRTARRLRRTLLRAVEAEFTARLAGLGDDRLDRAGADLLDGSRTVGEVVRVLLGELTASG